MEVYIILSWGEGGGGSGSGCVYSIIVLIYENVGFWSDKTKETKIKVKIKRRSFIKFILKLFF